jgi:uncharacterized cupredoxin-like copper-binding protein
MNTSTDLSKCATLGAALIATVVIVAAPSARADEMVVVMLADKGMESMRMDLSANQIKAGKVTFNVSNTSQNLVHEFVVVKSDKPIESLLYNEDEKEIKEDALEVVNEIEDIEPGKSGTLTVNLESGSYILFCNKAGHFKGGMVNHLTVIK